MRYQITEHDDYIRAVIADSAEIDDFMALYKELQLRSTTRGFDRALVVLPESGVAAPDRLRTFENAGLIEGFRLALVCATWTLYQACSKAERAATRAGVQVRAFLQEMEGVSWLTSN